MPGTWVGLEIDKPVGKHGGQGYFSCEDKHALFVRPRNVLLEADEPAVE